MTCHRAVSGARSALWVRLVASHVTPAGLPLRYLPGLCVLCVPHGTSGLGITDHNTLVNYERLRMLTPSARRNIAGGATVGAGTEVCARCKGPKEKTRMNSSNCRGCEGVNRDARVTVPAAMAAEVAAAGEKLEVLVPALLASWLESRRLRLIATPSREQEREDLLAWFSVGDRRAQYDGPDNHDSVLKWALSNGYVSRNGAV